jgi:hypothetical protein
MHNVTFSNANYYYYFLIMSCIFANNNKAKKIRERAKFLLFTSYDEKLNRMDCVNFKI